MYLLKHMLWYQPNRCPTDSHSTMYLLKLSPSTYKNPILFLFTFHHVSIKTNFIYTTVKSVINSHSTMYLLKLFSRVSITYCPYTFTFHHVSIKTGKIWQLLSWGINSHSTMYLLKPVYQELLHLIHNIHIPPCIY